MSGFKKHYAALATTVISGLKKRNMNGFYCETKEDALKLALSFISEESVVTWGGSMSIIEIGLLDAIRSGNYKALDRDTATSPEETRKIYLEAFHSDYFLMSANAITSDGELVNIDGIGNRVAALVYGPHNIIVIAGMNKVEPDLDAAMKRARNTAAPVNNQRLDKNNPCVSRGKCCDCTANACICCNIAITRTSLLPNRIHVILVGEELGF